MHAIERAFKTFLDLVEGSVLGRLAGNEDIVVAGPRLVQPGRHDGRLEPPPDPVSKNGPAQSFGNRETEPGRRFRGIGVEARAGLQNEEGRRAPGPAPQSKEFGSLLERGEFQASTPLMCPKACLQQAS